MSKDLFLEILSKGAARIVVLAAVGFLGSFVYKLLYGNKKSGEAPDKNPHTGLGTIAAVVLLFNMCPVLGIIMGTFDSDDWIILGLDLVIIIAIISKRRQNKAEESQKADQSPADSASDKEKEE